jgi:hypothetical protein
MTRSNPRGCSAVPKPRSLLPVDRGAHVSAGSRSGESFASFTCMVGQHRCCSSGTWSPILPSRRTPGITVYRCAEAMTRRTRNSSEQRMGSRPSTEGSSCLRFLLFGTCCETVTADHGCKAAAMCKQYKILDFYCVCVTREPLPGFTVGRRSWLDAKGIDNGGTVQTDRGGRYEPRLVCRSHLVGGGRAWSVSKGGYAQKPRTHGGTPSVLSVDPIRSSRQSTRTRVPRTTIPPRFACPAAKRRAGTNHAARRSILVPTETSSSPTSAERCSSQRPQISGEENTCAIGSWSGSRSSC